VAIDPPATFLAERDRLPSFRSEYNMLVDMRRLMWKYLRPGVPYGHCHLFIQKNCPDMNWAQLRDFFQQKDIIVATGRVHKLSHLKLGRRTFFIECGTENAYERKERIKDSIRETISKQHLDKASTMVLASLGPTAVILAHQLLDEGICVWDTGHMFKHAAASLTETQFSPSVKPAGAAQSSRAARITTASTVDDVRPFCTVTEVVLPFAR
jgi:Glycosyltransferase GT-D fold